MPQAGHHGGRAMAGPPSAWVVRFAPLVPAGAPVLDLACGRGRHGRLFLDRGHPVVFVDRALSSVADLTDRPAATLIEADLEDGSPWPLPGRRFGGVVVTNYLHRPLTPALIGAVGSDGVLIYETFADGNARFGRPSCVDFLLKRGELLTLFGDALSIVAFEEGEVAVPRPAIVQRFVAVAPGRAPVAIPPA